jgi:hypothetical protein
MAPRRNGRAFALLVAGKTNDGLSWRRVTGLRCAVAARCARDS